MTEPDRRAIRWAAHQRARSEMFRPMRMGVDELAKALTPDDAYEVPDGDRGVTREPACPECGRIFKNPGAYTRHRIASGHGTPEPRVPNEQVAGRTDDLSKADLGFALTKAAPERRYALGILYTPNRLDAHGEWASSQDIHDAVIAFNRGGDKRLRKQHSDDAVIGEVVECYVWPFPHSASLMQADGTVRKASLPADTAYIGAIFTPEGWREVRDGRRRGFSMGGSTVRVKEALPS